MIKKIFCGTECECKFRCEAFFPQSKELQKGCKDACRSGYNVQSKEDYLINFVGEKESIENFDIDPDKNNEVSRCSLPGAQFDPVCNPDLLKKPNYTWAYAAGGIVILVLVIFLIRRKK